MNEKFSNLISLSKNKFNINLLETIDHRDLFPNLNKSLTNNKFNNPYSKIENNRNIETDFGIHKNNNLDNKEIDEENNNNIENINLENDDINRDNTNTAKKILNKAKISSKSFKNIVNSKLNNFQEFFNRLSPEKNNKFLSQNNYSEKKEIYNNILTKKDKNENDINIKEFIFKRNNNNINLNQDYYFSNDYKKENVNISYFKLNKKKESNISKNSFASHKENNNNLDVYNRLYNKSYYKKKKNNQNMIDENNCTFNPKLLSILKQNKKNNNECMDNFIKRQEQFNKYINKKKIDLKKDINQKESKKYTFTPNISCTSGSKYSIKLEAQRQEESKLDKANRMVYDSVKKIEEKNNYLFLAYNNKFSFIPTINKTKNFSYKKMKNNKNENFKKREKKVKKENNIKTESKYPKFKKYVNHEYDDIKSNYRNDKELMNRIKEENKKRIKRIDNMRKEQENEDYEGCTFKPDINKKNKFYYTNILNNNNEFNFYYNKVPIKEMSYVDYYNKKKYFKNRLTRSQSYNNPHNRKINNKYNYQQDNINNYSNFCPYYTYSHCCNFSPNNNYNINYNEYNDCCNSNSEDKNNLNIYDYCNNEEQFDDCYEEDDKGKRNFNNYNNIGGYLNMNHNSNYIFKSDGCKQINSVKKEDKENFLLINKLLYD